SSPSTSAREAAPNTSTALSSWAGVAAAPIVRQTARIHDTPIRRMGIRSPPKYTNEHTDNSSELALQAASGARGRGRPPQTQGASAQIREELSAAWGRRGWAASDRRDSRSAAWMRWQLAARRCPDRPGWPPHPGGWDSWRSCPWSWQRGWRVRSREQRRPPAVWTDGPWRRVARRSI